MAKNVCHYNDGGIIMNRIKMIDIDLQTVKDWINKTNEHIQTRWVSLGERKDEVVQIVS